MSEAPLQRLRGSGRAAAPRPESAEVSQRRWAAADEPFEL